MNPIANRIAVTVMAAFTASPFAVPARADQLLIEVIRQEPPNTLDGLPRPRNGTSQHEVLEVFGEPQAKGDPIGKPPIMRWEYEEFTVVFEGDRVVKAVPKLITVPTETLVEQQ